LTELALSAGTLVPSFDKDTTAYTATVPFLTPTTTVSATPQDPTATVTVNGTNQTASVNLAEGANTINVQVTNVGGEFKVYTVTVTRQSTASFGQQAYAKASNTDTLDEFGYSVAISGDILAVGAPFESSNATGINGDQSDTTASNAGAVFTFVRSGSTWSQEAYIKAFNTNKDDNFGWSVALSGDALAVGAPLEDSIGRGINTGEEADNTATNSGAVYVFTRDSSGWSQQAYIKASNSLAGDKFGWTVALEGEVLAVGANSSNSSSSYDGAAYAFIGSGGSWTEEEYLKAFNADPYDGFGYSVALDGGTLAVGANMEDSNATGVDGDYTDNSDPNSGAVYVFQ
jgi:hypothetical protein